MLTGLLRLRRSAGGSLYLSHLLWKQVGYCPVLFVVMMLSHCILRSFQGVIWLAIATAAELPQVVSLVVAHTGFRYLSPSHTVVAPFFECER